MNILVIEDQKKHQQSARETLADHDVTIVDSFDEARALFRTRTDQDKVQQLLVAAGFETLPSSDNKERRKAYWEAHRRAEEASRIPFPFDVVLTDMMMPMSRETLSSEAFKRDEQVPYGYVLAIKAALCGARYVAMVTDINHHRNAMSAALDCIDEALLVMNGAKVKFMHAPFVVRITKDAPCDLCTKNPGVCFNCNGTGLNKDPKQKCYSCGDTDNIGKCAQCKGTRLCDSRETLDTKNWGQVLTSLISE